MMIKLSGFTRHVGKGSSSEVLPHRTAMTKLAGGDPLKRTMSQYAKATPSGASAPLESASLVGMAKAGTDLARK